jgi:hypothetical protein
MRIRGRVLRASTLAERRLLKALGVDALRVPRRLNPFAVARALHKVAAGTGGDLPALKKLLQLPSPAPELPDSRDEERAA